ncbi:MAG: haloacid dehalogenase-like hydrolase [Chloroflexi bacterium]|nr:haloacid dehalogenase-like hydrolase [Chloroflexota bacterium]
MTDWVVVNYLRPLFREDTTQLLKDHLAQSDLVVLVSSGPTPLLARIGAEWGVEHVVGTVPAKKDGRFTGGVAGRVCIDETKASFARDYLSARGFKVDYAASYAYGDSTSDLGLLEMAGNPVAVYPDKGLKPIAAARGWRVFPG